MDAAETLNRFFESTFTQESQSQIPVPPFKIDNSICNVDIPETVVLQRLSVLQVNKAPGPDGLHAYVLKACVNTLYAPLTILYQQSLSNGVLPKEWK